MNFSIKISDETKQAWDHFWHSSQEVVVLPLFEGEPLQGACASLETITKGLLAKLSKNQNFEAKAGQIFSVYQPQELGCARLILLGLGKKSMLDDKKLRQGLAQILKSHRTSDCEKWTWLAHQTPLFQQNGLCALVGEVSDSHYDVALRFGLKKKRVEDKDIEKFAEKQQHAILLAKSDLVEAKKALAYAQALNTGMLLTKDLGNLPSNFCTPSYLAEQAKKLAKTHKSLKVNVLDEKEIKQLRMGAFLSVTAGSKEPPKFIVLEYKGGHSSDAPIVLIGKGITFDTGGISLKPAEGMENMKYDMCGAATVLGTLHAAATLGLEKNIVGLIPTCENMPSGTATKPGDVVTTMSGLTVEIINTDAEGRLILCDALTYAERFKPQAVIDVATLTGACVVALGTVHSGLFGNNEDLIAQLLAAGKMANDTAWGMPLDDDYQEQLKSGFADMMNVGGRMAGSITAACYLSRFAEKYAWAHLDIAGTAQKGSGASILATARPVPLLFNFLSQQAESSQHKARVTVKK